MMLFAPKRAPPMLMFLPSNRHTVTDHWRDRLYFGKVNLITEAYTPTLMYLHLQPQRMFSMSLREPPYECYYCGDSYGIVAA